MKPVAVGLTVLAGAALFEAALVPGLAIGAAAFFAPKLLRGAMRRVTRPARKAKPAALVAAPPPIGRYSVKLAAIKAISYRIVATSIDFTSNIIVIGELGPAMGISAVGFITAPLFFFLHETLWQRYGTVEQGGPHAVLDHLPANRALAKTITFRALATTSDFSANYYFTRDLGQASALTAFGFVIGPFLYYAHEKTWERFSPGYHGAPVTVSQKSRILPSRTPVAPGR